MARFAPARAKCVDVYVSTDLVCLAGMVRVLSLCKAESSVLSFRDFETLILLSRITSSWSNIFIS